MDAQTRIAALNAEVAARDAIIVAKDAQIAARDARIQEIEQVVATLTQQVAALLRQVEQLAERVNRNSRNSNLPPSSDPPGSGGPSPNKGGRGGTRKRGGQPGHRGRHRQLAPKAQVDEFVDFFSRALRELLGAVAPDPRSFREALPTRGAAAHRAAHHGIPATHSEVPGLRV